VDRCTACQFCRLGRTDAWGHASCMDIFFGFYDFVLGSREVGCFHEIGNFMPQCHNLCGAEEHILGFMHSLTLACGCMRLRITRKPRTRRSAYF